MKKKIISLSLVAFLLVLVGYVSYNLSPKSVYEQSVNRVTKMDISERQAHVDKIVEDGMMNVNYTTSITMKDGVFEDFNIKNIENNKHPIKFKVLSEDNDLLFESGLIELGYEMNGLRLLKSLDKGVHNCRILIGYAEEGNVESSFPLVLVVE